MQLNFFPGSIRLFLLINLFFVEIASAVIPHPDHVVVLILENHSYNQVNGNVAAPYLNGLINNNKTALFTQAFGVSHPSQPNYLQFFSGSNQGVTNNVLPTGLPFTTPNLGAELIAASKTFTGYSETLPSVGYTGENSGAYARKHNPWVNWQGSGINGIPSTCNQPFTAFPSNYNLLPNVSIVVPNLTNCMHDGTDPARISLCDTWVQNNLGAYVQWAMTHNSLLIVTFDEDDGASLQHILTFFTGPMVAKGSYSNYVDHYSILRLIEDMFSLTHAGAAASAAPIDYCWESCQQSATISPGGPISFCQGSSVTLNASNGSSFLWSNGLTSQSVVATTAGNYSVRVTDSNGCTSTSSDVVVTTNNFISNGSVLNETMGTVSVNSTIATHESNNGFDNDVLLMTGLGEVRASSPSSGYTGASGQGNIYLKTTAGTNFIISNINTTNLSNLQLSFGIFKNTTSSTGSDISVLISTDGTNYSPLTLPALPSGSGTGTWYYRTVTGNIPATSNLRIQFLQNGITTQYRIDDITLSYSISTPAITASGNTTFCQGGSVTLSASKSSSYNWSNGSSNQIINVITSGNYSVIETGTNGCTASSNVINVEVGQAPSIINFSPASVTSGGVVTINGTNFSGTSVVSFNGTNATNFTLNNNEILATVPPGTTAGQISIINNCGNTTSQNAYTVIPNIGTFDFKLFIQGYYIGNGHMISVLGNGICDSVTVELHQPNPPYDILYSSKGVINTNGEGTFIFNDVVNFSFYVAVYNRNSVRVWSSTPVQFNSNTNYDFTLANSQAYGNNMKNLGDGNFAAFSGDISQNGGVDAIDMSLLEDDSDAATWGYNPTDLNGDGASDALDMTIVEGNNNQGVFESHP